MRVLGDGQLGSRANADTLAHPEEGLHAASSVVTCSVTMLFMVAIRKRLKESESEGDFERGIMI